MELTNISRFAKLLPSEGEAGRKAFEGDLARLQDKLRNARNGSANGGTVNAVQLRAAANASAQADKSASEFHDRHTEALSEIGSGKLYQENREADFPLPHAALGEEASSKGLREVIMHGVYGPTEFERAEQITRMQNSFTDAARRDMRDVVDRLNEARLAYQKFQLESDLACSQLDQLEDEQHNLKFELHDLRDSIRNNRFEELTEYDVEYDRLSERLDVVSAERDRFMKVELERLGKLDAEYKTALFEAQKETDAFLEKHGWRYELTEAERREITEFEVNAPGGLDLADNKKWGADVRKGFYSELNQQMEMERLRDASQKNEVARSVANTKESSLCKEAAPAEERASEQKRTAGKQMTASEGRDAERGEQRDSSTGMVYSDGHVMRGPGEGKVFQDGQVLTTMSEDEKKAHNEQMAKAAGSMEFNMVRRIDERQEAAAKAAEAEGKTAPSHETQFRAARAQERMNSSGEMALQRDVALTYSNAQDKQATHERSEVHSATHSRAHSAQERLNGRDERPEHGVQQSTEVRQQPPVEAAPKAPLAQAGTAQAPQQAAPEQAPAPQPAVAPAPQRSQAMSR